VNKFAKFVFFQADYVTITTLGLLNVNFHQPSFVALLLLLIFIFLLGCFILFMYMLDTDYIIAPLYTNIMIEEKIFFEKDILIWLLSLGVFFILPYKWRFMMIGMYIIVILAYTVLRKHPFPPIMINLWKYHSYRIFCIDNHKTLFLITRNTYQPKQHLPRIKVSPLSELLFKEMDT
jgi:hypothetical protein